MDKLDVLMVLLGIGSYMAIMLDLRNYERKVAVFEAMQDRRRKNAEKQAERRKAEIEMERSIEAKVKDKLTLGADEMVLKKAGKA